ncbi:MAG: hypothetical protein JKY31_01465 [Rhodobacteraceae bacterium]|nr:hypothetical protein [Paracoccaceae bacterium]
MQQSTRKKSILYKLTCLTLSTSLMLGGCAIPSPGGGALHANASQAETDLHNRANAMQKTIVEAIAVGALAGLAVGALDNRGGRRFGDLGVGGYLLSGALVGALAGTYVAFLQKDFASKEERLERARADIRANNAETRATLQVMRSVLATQVRELNRLKAAVAAGTADSAQLTQELTEARANLREMERAANGASRRYQDFSRVRGLVAVNSGSGNIDGELQELSERIAAMREVAADLAEEI